VVDAVKAKRLKVLGALTAAGVGAYVLGGRKPRVAAAPPPHDAVAPVSSVMPVDMTAVRREVDFGRGLAAASQRAMSSPFSWAVVEATVPDPAKPWVPGASFDVGPPQPMPLWKLKAAAIRLTHGGNAHDAPPWFWQQQADRISNGQPWLLEARDIGLYEEAAGSFGAGGGGGGRLGRLDKHYKTAREMWPAPTSYMEKKAAFLAIAREGCFRGFYPPFDGVGEALTTVLITEVSPFAGGYANHRVVADPDRRFNNGKMWEFTPYRVPPSESVGWRYRRLNGWAHRMLAWWFPFYGSQFKHGEARAIGMAEELDYVHRHYGGFVSPKNEMLNVRLAMLLGKWSIDHSRTMSLDFDPDEAEAMLAASFIVGIIAVAINYFTGVDIKDWGVNYDEWFEDSLGEMEHKFKNDKYLMEWDGEALYAEEDGKVVWLPSSAVA